MHASSSSKFVSATSVKITDCGLSTNMFNRSHVTVGQAEVPYRSEEAILKGRFGEASDLRVFGVLAWELFPETGEKLARTATCGPLAYSPGNC
jgi:hypothetical protein